MDDVAESRRVVVLVVRVVVVVVVEGLGKEKASLVHERKLTRLIQAKTRRQFVVE